MDLCTGGTLERMLREDKMFPEFAMIDIGRQLVAGLKFIHSHGVIFADWYPTRIFLDGCGNIKYYDFSYARMAGEKAADIFSASGVEVSKFDGLSHSALPYAAPEVLSGAPASRASDVWSLGCIFFRMFFGVVPFSSQVPSHLIQMICTRELEIPIQCTRKPSADLWALLCAMLTKDPRTRITLEDTLDHSFWLLKSTPGDNPPTISSTDASDRLTNPIAAEKQDTSTSSCIVRKRNGVVNVNGRRQSVTEDTAVKTLKRSVSMGDNALASAALLRKKTSLRRTAPSQKEATNKGGDALHVRLHSEDPASTNHGTPVGEANFTLHAQACPVSMRSGVFDPHTDTKASPTASSNCESVDMSSRSNSRIIATPDSTKKTFFESNDSLQPPVSPMPNEERMIKSEYVFRNSDTSGRFGSSQLHRSPLPDRIASLISPQTRARIALLYPWGDDALTLPREATIPIGRDSREWEDLFMSDELEEFNALRENNEKSPSAYRPRFIYTPQPLGDYKKWLQNPPKTELRLPLDLPVLSPSAINSMTNEETNSYSSKMMDSLRLQDPKNRPSTFLSYVVWFLAATTLESKPSDSPNPLDGASVKDIILRIKYYLSGAASLLRLDSISIIGKTWLFRIISLLTHRATFMIQQDSEDPNRESLIHTLIIEVAPELPSILSTVVDILREPAFKSVFSLKQAGIIALGELLVCKMCIYSRVLLDPTTYEDLTAQSFDISKTQWQSAVLRLIRSLSPSTSRCGNASQYHCVSRDSARPLERGNSSLLSSSKSSSTASANGDTCRLAAARVLNETIIVVIGCKLMRLLQLFDMQNFDRDHPGVQVAVTLSSSVNAFLDCLLTPETVSRVWADGVTGGSGGGGDVKTSVFPTASTTSLNQQVAHASVSALTGLIRLRPSLFMCGLIDRNGTTAFMHKLNPTNGAKGQNTTFMAYLLSATTTGLLLPLAFHNKPLGSSLLRVGMKSGTPVACRRLLNNSCFLAAVMRQLESPHAMLRAKAYLLAAAALDSASSACSKTLISACDARLPSCLERDLRMTNQHYIRRSALDENSVFLSVESRSHSQMTLSTSPGLQYLGVATAIGAYATGECSSAKHTSATSVKPPSTMASSTYQERTKRTVSSAGPVLRSPMVQGSRQPTSTITPGVSLKTCLPAFFCLPGILTSSASVRNRLLLPPRDLSTEREDFCLIGFIARIFDHWASSMGTLTGVHRLDSPENQLLSVTLALAEDISRQIDVVESRRADLIKALLPALARLAVAPASDSITRTICVKIILDMKNIWCGGGEDTDSLTSSNISLNLSKSPSCRLSGLARSPLSSDRLNSKLSLPPRGSGVNRAASLRGGENKRPASSSSSSSVISTRSSSRVSSCRPNSYYEGSSTAVKGLKGYRVASTLRNNFQGPSPEVLLAVVDIVNSLLIPYASLLLDLREIAPSTYFLRLLLDCLQLSHYSNDSSPNHTSCTNSHLSFVKIWRLSDLPLCLIHFVTSCDCGSRRFSVQCFLALRLLSTLTLQWPQESGLFQILLAPSIEQTQNLLSVVYNMLVSMGGSILRHGRRESSNDASIHHPNCHPLAVTPSSSQGNSLLLKISTGTVGVRHLLVALELLNTLLNLLTDVVRYALQCRQRKCTDRSRLCQSSQNGQYEYSITDYLPKSPEDVCSVAERLLSLSRPPKHLPGILASLLEASSPDTVDRDCVLHREDNEREVAACLVTLATRALASLASLYGGEYCRTALSAAGLRGFTVALRRNGHRDGKRLLLRILRRLSESDPVCLGRMTGPAAKHLHSVIWKLRSVDNSAAVNALDIRAFAYETRIDSPDNKDLNKTLKGSVLINTHVVGARRKPLGGVEATHHRLLLQILLEVECSVSPFRGLLLRNEWGAVERIILPSLYNSSDYQVNFFKALAGIFNYHYEFVPGVEYDTSGRCQTYYAEVENVAEESNLAGVMVIDKQKLLCEPLGQPIDAGVWSASPMLKDSRITHSWIRYYLERRTGLLMKAMTHEQHKLAFSLDPDTSGRAGIQVSGAQTLMALDETSEARKKVIQKLGGLLKTTKSSELSTMTTELLGGTYRVEHLALSVPRQSTSTGCGIQSVAFGEETLENPHVALSMRALREKLKDFARALEESARISTAHVALQLIQFLRCLPANQATVQIVAGALDFIPASHRDLNRQLESGWHAHLTDIVVDCGTDLCLELIRQRLVKVTALAAFDKIGSAAPREVRPIRTYVSDVLWPAIAHISNPSMKILKELLAICYHALPAMEKSSQVEENDFVNPYSCLSAIASIIPKFKGNYAEEKLLFSRVEETLINFTTLGSKPPEDSRLYRQKLLTTFTAIEKIRSSAFSEVLLTILGNSQVPSVIRAVGLKVLGKLDLVANTAAYDRVVSNLTDLIDSPTPSPFFHNVEEELILKFGAFSVLLNFEIPAPTIARILATFGIKKQWSLLTSCRRLVDSWCANELLSEAGCRCIKYGGPFYGDTGVAGRPLTTCLPGLAAGWSGLAGTKTAGEVNLIQGDLLDSRPYFLSDYSLQWITGSEGEIRASNLILSLIDAESEVKVLSFDIYGDQLAVLMGKGDSRKTPWLSVGFSLLRGTIPPRQVFSGGFTDLFSLLFSAPDQPTQFFGATRLPMDVRRYIPLSSGWILRNDLMGVSTIEFSAALSSSVLSQTVTALIRTRAAIVVENSITVITSPGESLPVISVVNGVGTAARFDFLIHMEVQGMPESICMHFQRSRMTPLLRWVGKFADSPILGRRTTLLHPLPTPQEGSNEHYKLTQSLRIPPVSYFLGRLNAARCRKVGVNNEWN
ncbi:Serine/threonine-protein kinase ULK4 [Taenia solium]|eukprot:TsM_000957100 transcript=TsM_000957100 gene=TsM_000957100